MLTTKLMPLSTPTRPFRPIVAALAILTAALTPPGARAEGTQRPNLPPGQDMPSKTGPVRIAYLHHSVGRNVWDGGVAEFFKAWNAAHGTDYRIEELTYPATLGGAPRFLKVLPYRVLHAVLPHYPWENYPYDYWNLWVKHAGGERDRGELNLDDLVKDHDVIVFKHCYPVSGMEPDDGNPSVSSRKKTLANYRLQYEALKARLHQFPGKKFVVWTAAALPQQATTPAQAALAGAFVEWVKGSWDERGDNVFLWDFHALETEGGPYLQDTYAAGPADPHPNAAFSRKVAPLIGRRIVDVIEGRGDQASLTGQDVPGPGKSAALGAR